jgi:beta-N-acetylhexosaminidase
MSGRAPQLERWAHAVLLAATAGTRTPPEWLRRRLDAGLGGVCLFGRNVVDPAQLRTFTDALRAGRGDVLVAVDEEGGDVTRLHRTDGSPQLGHLALGAVDDLGFTTATAAAIGHELAQGGIDWDFAPVVDVNAAPDSPVIGVRSFGSRPHRVGLHVAAYVTGLARSGILSCAKHFPGHGATSADSHTALPRVTVDRTVLDEVHLPPFSAAVAAGVDTVMVGHLLVRCLDDALPASLSPAAMRLLREGLGFDGVIVTDALDMNAVAGRWGIPGSTVLAVAAGADAVCLSGRLLGEDEVRSCVSALVDAVRGGRLPEERLAEAAERVGRLAARQEERRTGAVEPEVTERVPVVADPGTAPSATGPAPSATTPSPTAPSAVRSLRLRGDTALPPGPLTVVAFDPPPSIAAGRSPWNPSAALAARRPGSRLRYVQDPQLADPVAPADPVTPADPGRCVLAVVRDLHRHPWAHACLRELLEARPDTVVVELGVPVLDPGARGWVCTHGAGAASVAAAADALALS